MTFKEFMKEVDREVQSITGGVSVHDLADYCFRDAYDCEEAPYDVAMEALQNDDLGASFLAGNFG